MVFDLAAKTELLKHGIEGNPKWDTIQEILQEIQAEIQDLATPGAHEKVLASRLLPCSF